MIIESGRCRGFTYRAVVSLFSAVTLASVSLLAGAGDARSAAPSTDDFSRTVSGGWGGSWTTCSGSCAAWHSVSGGKARLNLPSGKGPEAYLSGTSSTDTDVATDVTLAQAPDAGAAYIAIVARGEARGGYRGRVKISSNNRIRLDILRADSAKATSLKSVDLGAGAFVPGRTYRLRMQATGVWPTQLRLKIWSTGQAEPDWQLETTDSSATWQKANGVGAWAYLSSRASNGPAKFTLDRFSTSNTETPSVPPPPAGIAGPDNTGVPPDTQLKTHNGDLEIVKDGAVIDGLDVRGFVHVLAANVQIKNSIVRGGTPNRDIGLVNVTEPGASLKMSNSTLIPSNPSYRIDGVRGSHFQLSGVEISKTVDGVFVHGKVSDRSAGGNVTVDRVWVHGLRYFANDPRHSNGSHNDAVQILGGKDISIRNSRLEAQGGNAAIQLTDGYHVVADLTIEDNYATGGACTFNIDQRVSPITGVRIQNNEIGPDSPYRCGMIIDRSINPVLINNTWSATGSPTSVVWR